MTFLCREIIQLALRIWFSYKMNPFIYIRCIFCLILALSIMIETAKRQMRFSPQCSFRLTIMFRYHFLGHCSAELNDICYTSSLHIILATYTQIFLETLHICFLFDTIWNVVKLCVCVYNTHIIIKNVLLIKTKNTRVRFFNYMPSMCVQLFTRLKRTSQIFYLSAQIVFQCKSAGISP